MRVSIFNNANDIGKLFNGAIPPSSSSAAFLIIDSEFNPVPGEVRIIQDPDDVAAYILHKLAGVQPSPNKQKKNPLD